MQDLRSSADRALPDLRWLVGPEAERALSVAAELADPLAAATALRKSLPAERVALVLEQARLRRRAADKFPLSAKMFFTARGLEQATDAWVAAYKANRFPPGQPVADLCCGIGGDLSALAAGRSVLGVDADPAMVLFAAANGRVAGVEAAFETARAAERHVAGCSAWHIDPDRRPGPRRTTRLACHDPDRDALARLLATNPHGAIKLSPAAELPVDWAEAAEAEWISRARQCRQLVVWQGHLASHPGRRRATLLDSEGQVAWSFAGGGPALPPVAARVGRFVFEPDPAVLAADLVGPLAEQFSLESVAPAPGYLTADAPCGCAALAAFEVLAVLPYDRRRVKEALRIRGMGRLEVKQRGADLEPALLRRQLRVTGDSPGTLLLARVGRQRLAIVARRVGEQATS